MYLLGYDIGSSSIKAAIVEIETAKVVASVQSPAIEMKINAVQEGWAEQDPELWWKHLCMATKSLLSKQDISGQDIKSIGISYQMHGLVLVDKNQQVLRPSIIWCDSRAVAIGKKAFDEIGQEACLSQLLNSPGNFTASKLKWVKDNEPAIYEKIDKILLPGDYIAMRLTSEVATTPSGLSEAILWDFKEHKIAHNVLDYFGFKKEIIPTVTSTFSLQGKLTKEASEMTGLPIGIPISYRAGDQPNNALSLNVLQAGEVAATGGTSGVVYGVLDKPVYDAQSRVNGFAHVNHTKAAPRIGVLLCINGAGIQYKWIREYMTLGRFTYQKMNEIAASVAVGSDGLRVLPFGNGAERMLGNRTTGGHISNMQFNRHTNAHLYRAGLEGIAFSFVRGVRVLQEMGVDVSVMRVGNDNLFRSKIFSETISTLLNCSIQVIETTGAVGAAKASGVATGYYSSVEEAMRNTDTIATFEPQKSRTIYTTAFEAWEQDLEKIIIQGI